MIVRVNWADTSKLSASTDTIEKARKKANGKDALLISFNDTNDDSLIDAGIVKYLKEKEYKDMFIEFTNGEEEKRYSVFVWGNDVQRRSLDMWTCDVIGKAETTIGDMETKRIAAAWEQFAKKHFLNDWNDTFEERFFVNMYRKGNIGYFNTTYNDADMLREVTQREPVMDMLWR